MSQVEYVRLGRKAFFITNEEAEMVEPNIILNLPLVRKDICIYRTLPDFATQ